MSVSMRRAIQWRTGIGIDAIGTRASMQAGYNSPHSHVCMPPPEWPSTERVWDDDEVLLSIERLASREQFASEAGAQHRVT